MTITKRDVPLITATLRHELMPSPATRRALNLTIEQHRSFPETGEQEVGRGQGEHAIPADDLAPEQDPLTGGDRRKSPRGPNL